MTEQLMTLEDLQHMKRALDDAHVPSNPMYVECSLTTLEGILGIGGVDDVINELDSLDYLEVIGLYKDNSGEYILTIEYNPDT
jgi:hypothetical protein